MVGTVSGHDASSCLRARGQAVEEVRPVSACPLAVEREQVHLATALSGHAPVLPGVSYASVLVLRFCAI